MTVAEILTTVAAGVLIASGVLFALVTDVRAHGDRPRLDRIWLIVPIGGLAALFVAVLS